MTEFRLGLGSVALDLVATVADRPGTHRERLNTPDDLDRWLVEAGLAPAATAPAARRSSSPRRETCAKRSGRWSSGPLPTAPRGLRTAASSTSGPPGTRRCPSWRLVGRRSPAARMSAPRCRRWRGTRSTCCPDRTGPGSAAAAGARSTSWTARGRATGAGARWSCAATAARRKPSGTGRSSEPRRATSASRPRSRRPWARRRPVPPRGPSGSGRPGRGWSAAPTSADRSGRRPGWPRC